MNNDRPTALPANAEKYRETREFTEFTVPKGLLADHNTADGVWGVLRILEGQLVYIRQENAPVVVTPDQARVIYPKEKHRIACDVPVKFKVEFYRVTD